LAGGRGSLVGAGTSVAASILDGWDLAAGRARERSRAGDAGAGGVGAAGAVLRGVDLLPRWGRGVADSVPVPEEVLSSSGGRKVTGGGAFAGFVGGAGWFGVLNAGFDVRGRRCFGSFSSMPSEPSRAAAVSPVGRRCGRSISTDFDDRRGLGATSLPGAGAVRYPQPSVACKLPGRLRLVRSMAPHC
jgi:hypothetical protein